MSELKGINQLEIITLGELLDRYDDTNGRPTNCDEVHELATLLSNKLGRNCVRYKSNYEKYQNVDDHYIYIIVIELLGIHYECNVSKYTDETASDESSEEEIEKEEDEIDEDEVLSFIYQFMSMDISELKKQYRSVLGKKGIDKKSKYTLLKELGEYNIRERPYMEDPCEDTQQIHYDIILAVDLSEENVYRNRTLSEKIEKEYEDDEKKELLDPLKYESILDRIHGLLIMKYGGCNTFASSYPPPNIIQLSVVCTSTYPYSDKKAIGVYLIGSFLLLSKLREFDLVVLEVANDCVGSDENVNGEKYGGLIYHLGKQSQKSLYCLYERFGFREDPSFHEKYNCFSDDPYPTMVMDLQKYTMECISSVILNRNYWTDEASNFCKDGYYIEGTHTNSDLCG